MSLRLIYVLRRGGRAGGNLSKQHLRMTVLSPYFSFLAMLSVFLSGFESLDREREEQHTEGMIHFFKSQEISNY